MFSAATYVPSIAVRPSEMEGLRRLPDADKDRILPSIRIGKWNGSHHLARTFEGLEKAFGSRNIIADLAPPPVVLKTHADQELVDLNQSTNGHAAWTSLIRQHGNFVPTLQWGPSDSDNIQQAGSLLSLSRGLVIRLRRANQWDLQRLQTISTLPLRQSPIMLVLDFGQITQRLDNKTRPCQFSYLRQKGEGLKDYLPDIKRIFIYHG